MFLVAACESIADCPGPLGGLSAVVAEEATRNLCVSGGELSVHSRLSGPGARTVRRCVVPAHRNLQVSGGASL